MGGHVQLAVGVRIRISDISGAAALASSKPGNERLEVER
jgi:hypothetical protein